MDEKQALHALQNGSQDALIWFMDRYGAYVSTIFSQIFGSHMSRQDAEEVASDVFLALWNQCGRIRTGNIKAYLGRMARNMALNKFREAGFTLPLEEGRIETEGDTPEGELLRKEAAEIVTREVARMKEPEREILLRFYYYFQSVEQIAREMKLQPANVKTKLFRARKALKSVLAHKLG